MRRSFERYQPIFIAAGLAIVLMCGGAGWAQNARTGDGAHGDQFIARFVNGTFTFISTGGRVEGYDLRPAFYFLTSQFSTDGTHVAGYADLTFTVLDQNLETVWTRKTTLRNIVGLAVSPRGTRIAYFNRVEPGSEHLVLGVVGEEFDTPALATADGGGEIEAYSIGWDAAGERVVFDADGSITVVGSDGRNGTVIGSGCAPSWSPDGLEISYRDNEGYGVIYDVASRSSHRLKVARSRCAAFHWAPDSRLAFTREASAGSPSGDCFDSDRFVIYRMENGQRLGIYNPCGLRDSTYGWLRDRSQWRAAVRRRVPGHK